MLLLDQQRRADALVSPGNATLLVATAAVEQLTIQFFEISGLRHRHPVVPAEIAGFSLHATLLMPFARRAELAVEAPMRPECDEPRRLFPTLTAQNLLYRSFQVVVTEPAKHPAEKGERQFMRFEERLLSGVQERAVKRCATGHTPHGEHLQFRPLPGQIGDGFVPINLRFHAPVVALRHKHFVDHQAQGSLTFLDVLPNRPLANRALLHLRSHPLPDPVCSVALLPRRLSIQLQNPVHERHGAGQFPTWSFRLLSWGWQRAADRFSHHPPVHLQLLCHTGDRADAELVLSSDLFKQLHLCSPIQRVPPLGVYARSRVPVRWEGGPKQTAEVGQFRIPKSWGDSL